jgi:hypothetical protein
MANREQEGREAIEASVDDLIAKLGPWARHMAARYNAPVYLIGSTLHSPTPRDCDVRIVVSDPSFVARYGNNTEYRETRERSALRDRGITASDHVLWNEEGPTQAWVDDVAKFNDHLSCALKRNMDVQVVPESWWMRCYPAPVLLAEPRRSGWFYSKLMPDPSAPQDLENAPSHPAVPQEMPDDAAV